jgi:hypothetical protein
LKAYTLGNTNHYLVPLTLSSCGSENIVLTSIINPVVATFNKGSGLQVVVYSSETAKITVDDPYCPIIFYQILDSTLKFYSGSKFAV